MIFMSVFVEASVKLVMATKEKKKGNKALFKQ